MDPFSKYLSLISIVLGIASVILSAISWARITYLSLPFPLAFPVLSTITALIGPFAMAFAAKAKTRTLAILAPYFRYFLPFLPFAIFILSLVYGVPSDIMSCSLESQWTNLFRAKNEDAVRGIENALRCCGFNSLQDRAWPFPSHDVDVRACERTLGYTRRCVDPWRNQEQVAVGLIAVASLFNWILLHLVDMAAQPSRRSARFPAASDFRSEHSRLLRGAEEDQEYGGSGNAHVSYSDHRTPKAFDIVGDSGKVNRHYFCGNCGSSLYCELEAMPDNTVIKAGSLDQPDVKEMQAELYVKDRVSYMKPIEGAKQVPAFL
ncbi:hypothetical protein CLAIMM_12187 [Cladophialophora immunda]|nr:hypothetical protein CLAIMM_12187 [Cladophialophora immunda]